jgi:hypothetical protein
MGEENMQTAPRNLFVASCLALMVAAMGCGGSSDGPTGPSGVAGATVAGTVSRTTGSPLGLTVSVAGTNLSTNVEGSGYFQLGSVPAGDIQLQFRDAAVNATAQLSQVRQNEFIEIQVQVSGASATIVSESRSEGKVTLCHRTESGTYQKIDVSVNAEPAHRDHGDAKVGEPVPGTQKQVFDENCRPAGPAVKIEKSTNGEDADSAPGPSIVVGSAVTWRYVVTNTGTVQLTGIVVSDDKLGAVSCGQTTLDPGLSMTCTMSGVAALGQYSNVGTVNANPGPVSDTDPSHYLGITPQTEEEGPKVQLCHKTGASFYVPIEVSVSAVPAHLAHGDGKIGEAVPGQTGKVFGTGCSVR